MRPHGICTLFLTALLLLSWGPAAAAQAPSVGLQSWNAILERLRAGAPGPYAVYLGSPDNRLPRLLAAGVIATLDIPVVVLRSGDQVRNPMTDRLVGGDRLQNFFGASAGTLLFLDADGMPIPQLSIPQAMHGNDADRDHQQVADLGMGLEHVGVEVVALVHGGLPPAAGSARSGLSSQVTRTVVFPGGPISEVPSFWSEEQLFVKIIRNTLVFQLRDPLFTGTIQVFDDKGNLFLLNVRAARGGETVDDVLLIRPLDVAGGAAAPMPGDSDGAVTELMAHMVGGGPNPAISGSLVTHVDEHGKVVPGRRIFADDTLTLELFKVYQGPGLRGYECLVRYAGERTVRLDQQRLWFPGALAVYASNQVFINPQTVQVEIQPNQAIRIFYVAE